MPAVRHSERFGVGELVRMSVSDLHLLREICSNRAMDVASLMLDLYSRIPPLANDIVEGMDLAAVMEPPAPGANPIGWLLWHLARVQDDHVAEVMGTDQIWIHDDWARRFGLDADPSNIGYGHTPDDVAAVRPETPSVLLEYLDIVHRRTVKWLEGLSAADLDRIVDERWDPPVTLGIRLISVADDSLQHLGQAAYVRGLRPS